MSVAIITGASRGLGRALAGGLGIPVPQQGTPTYAQKIEPADLFLDWHRPAAELHHRDRPLAEAGPPRHH